MFDTIKTLSCLLLLAALIKAFSLLCYFPVAADVEGSSNSSWAQTFSPSTVATQIDEQDSIWRTLEMSVWGLGTLAVLAYGRTPCFSLLSSSKRFSVFSSSKRGKSAASAKAPKKAHPRVARQHTLKEQVALHQQALRQAAVEIEAQKKSELLVHYAKNGDVAQMLRTLEEMEESGCIVTMASYATAVKVTAKSGDSCTAHLWLLRAIEVGHIPTVDVFHAVINAYAKQRHLEKVENLVGLVHKAGLTLDTITYNTIIEACARVGDADAAQSWMRRMLDQKVQASVVTFGFLFLACANAGQIENLNKWFAMSQDAGIQCNWDCLNPVIKSLLFKNDDVVNASKWVMHMIETGRPPNTQLFIDVLNRSLEIDNADLTARIWQQMRATGVACDWPVYNQCILSAIKYQRKEFAQEWADESVARNIKITFAVRRIMTKADVKYRARADQFENLAAASPEDDIAVSDQKLGAPKGVEGRQVGPSQLSGEEARLACFGKDFTGVIKDFVPQKFGHIACDETFKIFGRDIFLAPSRNPEKLGKGQRVHFTVMPDGPTGHPRACDVRAWRPAKVQGTPTDQVGEI